MNHFFRAFKYSMQGLRAAYKTEVAFRQEVHLFAILFPASFFVSNSIYDFLLLTSCMVFVLMAELLNTGLENTIDKTIPQKSKRAGMAKDQGSAAVFIGLVYTTICWALIIYKNFLANVFL